jgi:hypothetical protein
MLVHTAAADSTGVLDCTLDDVQDVGGRDSVGHQEQVLQQQYSSTSRTNK